MATKKDNTAADASMAQEQSSGGAALDTAAQIIAEAKEEAEKIIAAARAKAEQEAQTLAAAKETASARTGHAGDELVTVQLFRDNDKYKDDVFVAVNGERIQIRRGEPVRIKRKFADVLEQSMRQDTATAKMIERKSAEYEAQAKAMNI